VSLSRAIHFDDYERDTEFGSRYWSDGRFPVAAMGGWESGDVLAARFRNGVVTRFCVLAGFPADGGVYVLRG